MKKTVKENHNTLTHSLILSRKIAFAELIRAYLKFNVASATEVTVTVNGDVMINEILFKLDISDYTGKNKDLGYIFFNPSSGRLVIEKGNINKVYKLEVNLLDEDN